MSTTEDRTLTVYEVGYLLLPSIAEDALGETVTKLNKIIEDAGAQMLGGEDPFLYPLAYQMRKTVGARKYIVDEAYLGWMKFEAEASKIESIKAEIEKLEEVLRFLIIKAPRESEFTFEKARREKQEAKEALEEAETALAEPAIEPVVE